MSSNRILKVNQLIKEELSKILLQESNLPSNMLATITRVETTPNLSEAKVFISVIPDEKAKKVIDEIKKRIYFLQQKLNKKLRMRPVPKIILLQEKETQKAARIEQLLEELKKEKK